MFSALNPISPTIFTNPSGCTHLNHTKLKHAPRTKCGARPARGESESVVCPVETILLELWKIIDLHLLPQSCKVSRDSWVWNVLLFRLSPVLGSLDNDYSTWHICPPKETEPGRNRKRQITEIRYTEADVSDLIWVPLVFSWHLWFVRWGRLGRSEEKQDDRPSIFCHKPFDWQGNTNTLHMVSV